MEKFYLIDYIKKNFNIEEDILDNIRHELDRHIYYYGNNFKSPKENATDSKVLLKTMLKNVINECRFMLKTLAENKVLCKKGNIVSNSYFLVNNELKKIGYNVYLPFWRDGIYTNVIADASIYRESRVIRRIFARWDFIDIISEKLFKKIEAFKEQLRHYYIANNISALIVPNDQAFFERLSLQIFRELKRPSFIFSHGLPNRYNNINNRSQYLIVWGESIKENYIKAGLAEDKILVSGHPYYNEPCRQKTRYGLENILVITKSMPGTPYNDGVHLSDRGNSVLYLYSIQNVLKRIGVKSIRLRIHPSESRKWYFKFIDNDFFIYDNEKLRNSLERSSLVIGPTSTVLLESVYYGVNYLVYEPAIDDIDVTNYRLVPPFDGSDERIPVAKNENELMRLLSNKTKIDVSFLKDYIKTPFDISFIKRYIKTSA